MATREEWMGVRCLFESPILDERKWAKVPTIEADAFILDLEDSVPLARKEEAREKVVEFLGRPEYFNGAKIIPRANHLDTPWGRDDLAALAEAGADVIMYPKTHSPDDVDAVTEVLAEHGSNAKLLVCIESARGVIEVERTFAKEQVVAAAFGSGDLHVDADFPLYVDDGEMNPTLLYSKRRCALAGAAFGLPVLTMVYTLDIKDLVLFEARLRDEKAIGFTGAASFYPPQVPLVNEVFSPSEADVAKAHEIIEIYELAVENGNPAVQLQSGEALLVHHYKEALALIERASGTTK